MSPTASSPTYLNIPDEFTKYILQGYSNNAQIWLDKTMIGYNYIGWKVIIV